MTQETNSYIGLEDIIALEFECTECATKMSRRLEHFTEAHQLCPSCNAQWLKKGTAEYDAVIDFARVVRDLKKGVEGRKFKMRVEITPLSDSRMA